MHEKIERKALAATTTPFPAGLLMQHYSRLQAVLATNVLVGRTPSPAAIDRVEGIKHEPDKQRDLLKTDWMDLPGMNDYVQQRILYLCRDNLAAMRKVIEAIQDEAGNITLNKQSLDTAAEVLGRRIQSGAGSVLVKNRMMSILDTLLMVAVNGIQNQNSEITVDGLHVNHGQRSMPDSDFKRLLKEFCFIKAQLLCVLERPDLLEWLNDVVSVSTRTGRIIKLTKTEVLEEFRRMQDGPEEKRRKNRERKKQLEKRKNRSKPTTGGTGSSDNDLEADEAIADYLKGKGRYDGGFFLN